MLTLTHVERERRKSGIPESGESIGWVADGTAFVVQNIEKLCATWLPMFFGQSKFSSFTRKMYRWGFRKINVASIPNGSSYSENALFFGNEHFLRSDKSQLSLMKSVTAAKTRSGAIGAVNRVREHRDQSESEADESKPQATEVVTLQPIPNIDHRGVEPSVGSAPSGDDMASLLQQSANLSYLLSVLASNQLNQTPPIQNPMLIESMRQSSVPPQIYQVQPSYMNQALQQFAVSAALRNAGIIQQNPLLPAVPQSLPTNLGSVPWWINSCIQLSQHPIQTTPQPLMQSWPAYPNRQDGVLQPALPQNVPPEQERLRGVMDNFLRYCESVQQQQSNTTRNPQTLLPPPPPPPPPSNQSRPP
jgi:HSF-type DNA-binding